MQNNHLEEEARGLLDLIRVLGRRGRLRNPLASIVEGCGLTPGQIHGVAWLGMDGELMMGELAHRLGVSEKTVTGIVDRLERAGLAERRRREGDRRVILVGLTKKGRAVHKRLDRQILVNAVGLLSALEDNELKVIRRLLERLIERPEILGGKVQS